MIKEPLRINNQINPLTLLFTAFLILLNSCELLNNDQEPEIDTSEYDEIMAFCQSGTPVTSVTFNDSTGTFKFHIPEKVADGVDVEMVVIAKSKIDSSIITSWDIYRDEYNFAAPDVYVEVVAQYVCQAHNPVTDQDEKTWGSSVKYSFDPEITTADVSDQIYFHEASFENGKVFDMIIRDDSYITNFYSFWPSMRHPIYGLFDKSYFSEELTIKVEDIPWGTNNYIRKTKIYSINYSNLNLATVGYNLLLNNGSEDEVYNEKFIGEIPHYQGKDWFYKFTGMTESEWDAVTTQQVLVTQDFKINNKVVYTYYYKIRKNVNVIIEL